MNTVIVHTDITGSPNWRRLGEVEPRVTRIVTVEVIDDHVVSLDVALLQPVDRAVFEPDAMIRHGITPELAMAQGRGRDMVLREVHAKLARAHVVAGYAVEFHERWLAREMGTWGMPYPTAMTSMCLMRGATPLAKIPDQRSSNGYKWPTLAQAARHFLGDDLLVDRDPVEDGRRIGVALTAIHAGIMEHRRVTDRAVSPERVS